MSTVKKVPQRQCIGCGEMKNKRELIRVLKGTDDVISIDATGEKTDAAHISAHPWHALKGSEEPGTGTLL